MGIESDQLVLDYLSRVGDLAQQRQLSSGDRMRLVSELRGRIESQRAHTADSPAAVKKILGKLGTPEDVVRSAGGRAPGGGGTESGRPEHRPAAKPGEPASPGPGGDSGDGAARGGTLRKLTGFARRTGLSGDDKVPSPRSGRKAPAAEPPAAEPPVVPVIPLDGPAPPHLAGEEELGPRGADTDWWRVEPGPFGAGPGGAGGPGSTGYFGPGESVPGFVGGIEIPEILKPPPHDPFRKESEPGPDAVETAEPDDAEEEAEPVRTGRLFRGGGRTASPLLLLAAALLIGGAVFGSLVALGLGWLIAYAGPRLSRMEAKWAALAVPGLVAAGALVWLWGRHEGRWGEPIASGTMAEALTETWPVALRTAAVASALFLLWRARRR